MTEQLTMTDPTVEELRIMTDIAEKHCPADEHVKPFFKINGQGMYDIFWLTDHYTDYVEPNMPKIEEVTLITCSPFNFQSLFI